MSAPSERFGERQRWLVGAARRSEDRSAAWHRVNRSDVLGQLALDHLWFPFSTSVNKSDPPTILLSGDGIYVTDADGKQYIDGIAALEAMAVGHGRMEFIRRGQHSNARTENPRHLPVRVTTSGRASGNTRENYARKPLPCLFHTGRR